MLLRTCFCNLPCVIRRKESHPARAESVGRSRPILLLHVRICQACTHLSIGYQARSFESIDLTTYNLVSQPLLTSLLLSSDPVEVSFGTLAD